MYWPWERTPRRGGGGGRWELLWVGYWRLWINHVWPFSLCIPYYHRLISNRCRHFFLVLNSLNVLLGNQTGTKLGTSVSPNLSALAQSKLLAQIRPITLKWDLRIHFIITWALCNLGVYVLTTPDAEHPQNRLYEMYVIIFLCCFDCQYAFKWGSLSCVCSIRSEDWDLNECFVLCSAAACARAPADGHPTRIPSARGLHEYSTRKHGLSSWPWRSAIQYTR